MIESAASVPSVSVTVARSAFTCDSVPVIVRLVVPEPDTPEPVAASFPFVSANVTVKVSLPVALVSAMLRPPTALDFA